MDKHHKTTVSEEILVILKDSEIYEKMDKMIQTKGYQATFASTLTDVTHLLNIKTFALMIIEIAADMDLRRKIIRKAGKIQPALSVMILTGNGDASALSHTLSYGIKWFSQKL